jgi:hypothetical protein
MKINLKAMREAGIEVEVTQDEITVHAVPLPAGMYHALQQLLRTNGLGAMGRDLVMAEFHDALAKAQLLEYIES